MLQASPPQHSGSELGPGTDRRSWLEMRTMLGWAPRWCEFCVATCLLTRQHAEDDRSTLKVSDLSEAQLRLEDGHSLRRYLEIAFARNPADGEEYTLRMRVPEDASGPEQEALAWVETIRRAQRAKQQEERAARCPLRVRHFRLLKQGGGNIGLALNETTVVEAAPGGAAAAAGLTPGMKIWTVDGQRVNKLDVFSSMIAAPQEVQVSVLLPEDDPRVIGAALSGKARRAIAQLARVGERRRELRVGARVLLGVAAFAADAGDAAGLRPWVEDNALRRASAASAESLRAAVRKARHRDPAELPPGAALPWDEEEPSAVASLRNLVERAQSLRDLERIDTADAEAFFTPLASPAGSERDCADAVGWQEIGRATKVEPTQKERPHEWTGPPTAPKAGLGSMVRCVPRRALDDAEPSTASDGYAAGWRLRCGPDYSHNRKKAPSLEALYSFHGADVYRSKQPLEHVASRLQLPKVSCDCAGLPPVFVFCAQIPFCESPSVWGQDLGGPTVNVILTFVCKESAAEATRAHDQGGEHCPGAALIREYGRRVPPGRRLTLADDAFLGRFKLAVRAAEGVPSAFAGYNGKPVLVTKSGRYFSGEGYLEVDCNMREWAYPARFALYTSWSKLGQFRCHIGLCVEAREDDEMDERLLGCCQVSEIDWDGAAEWHGE
eukprot:TRINITY_DN9766_c0_g1_i7.p1 TRINITY_DN9766_c0_g1~~TRINITY_DN9766_c0_g1_i7.p1  ORF type:complete len:667 (+),score=187.57 TRINITY_DN9766_c0_g1_i7:111-2111(+)